MKVLIKIQRLKNTLTEIILLFEFFYFYYYVNLLALLLFPFKKFSYFLNILKSLKNMFYLQFLISLFRNFKI